MHINELIIKLTEIRDKYGDLPIAGGYMVDDRSLTKVTLIDKRDCDCSFEKTKPVAVFFE